MTLIAAIDADHAQDPLVLTLDVGTSSVRAMLYDGQARAISGMETQRFHQMRSTPDGGVETDAGPLFDRVADCLDGVLHLAGPLASRIAAVAPDTFWHNVLGVDDAGQPCTPIYTWADTRAASAARALRGELDTAAIHATTGCVIHASYLPAKLRWLLGDPVGTHPGKDAVGRVRTWLSFAEYLTLRLFGTPSCSISMASGSGLLNQHRCAWDTTILAAIPIAADQLSPISDAPRTRMREPYASRWPVLARLPWFPGWGDGAMSNVGSGCVEQGQVAMMVGTSAAMRSVWETDHFTIPSRLWCYRMDAHRIVVGGALSNGGNLLDWLRTSLNLPGDLAALESEIAQMAPDAHGLTILPFLAGERSTGWHAEARGTITGLRLHTRPAEILRAGYEAIAYRLGLIYALLHEAIPGTGPVIASGGALLHSPTWLQMTADVLGAPVTASAVPEASSRGAALAALEALGAITRIGAIPAPLGATCRPDPVCTPVYQQGAARQQALYKVLIEQTPQS